MNVRFLALGSVLVCAAALVAQEKQDPLALVPADARLVAWSPGFGELQKAFAGTRLADVLGSRELRELIPMSDDDLHMMLEAGAQQLGIDSAALEEFARGYRGRIGFAVGLDFDALLTGIRNGDFDPDEVAPWSPWMMLVLSEDPDHGFGPVLDLFDRLAEQNASYITDLKVGDHDLRVYREDAEGFALALPFVHDGQLVLYLGTDLENELERILYGDDDAFATTHSDALGAPVGTWLDLSWASKLMGTLLPSEMDLDAPGQDADSQQIVDDVFGAIGLPALQSLQFALTPAGEHVVIDARIHLSKEQRGMLAMMTPDAPEAPPLGLVPLQATAWSVSAIDLDPVLQAVKSIATTLEPVTGTSWQSLEEQVADALHVQLADLIEPLGKVLLSVDMRTKADLTDQEQRTPIDGVCYGVTLDDAPRFREALETALRARGLHAARKTDEYQGFQVHRLPLPGLGELSYAVTDRVFLLGFGDAGAKGLRAILSEARDRLDGKPRPELPDAIKSRLEHALPDYQSVGALDVGTLVHAAAAGALSQIPDPDVADSVERAMDTLGQLFQRHGLTTMVSTSRGDEQGVRTRWIW